MKSPIRRFTVFAVLLLAAAWTLVLPAKEVGAGHEAIPPISLRVDLTQAPRKIFHAEMTIPVKPGPLTLLYPKWIPGEHGPTGPIQNLAGLEFTVNGKRIPWKRDLVNMFAFHLQIPEGASFLHVSLDFLSPVEEGDFSAGVSATPKLVDLNWNQVALYPAGHPTKDYTYKPVLILPKGWKFGTALGVENRSGSRVTFKPVSFNNLVDSPVIAGQYFRQCTLHDSAPFNYLDMVSDDPSALAIPKKILKGYRYLVNQAHALFGSYHYKSYHFLLTLSDHTAHFGLEHHQSSDDRTGERMLVDPQHFLFSAGLLPHEFVHSWNGKYRRPADLYQPDFNKPERTDMLWVYEGLTQYFGPVLTARSGLWTPKQFRQALAQAAASMDHTPGREWRPLIDTAISAPFLYGAPRYWESWRRSVDFYPEGTLIWLDVDTKIRELTKGRRSLDDFARNFYGMDDGSIITNTYTFDDIVTTLNHVAPYDWAGFLHDLLYRTGKHAPLAGITRSGWKLVYTDSPSTYLKAMEMVYKFHDLTDSIGLNFTDSGHITDVLWNGPAFKSGLGPGMQIIAVNGVDFTPRVMIEAVSRSSTSKAPVTLTVKNDGFLQTYSVDYHGGLKYPHLVREKGRPDVLTRIIKALPVKP